MKTEKMIQRSLITIAVGVTIHVLKKLFDNLLFKKPEKEDTSTKEAEKTKGYKERMDARFKAQKDYDRFQEELRREKMAYDKAQKEEAIVEDVKDKHPLRAVSKESPKVQPLGLLEINNTPQLLGKWLSAGEIEIVYGRSNIGKSLYMGQMAFEIAKQQRVDYYDIENNGLTFETRYGKASSLDHARNIRNVSPVSTLDFMLESICIEIEKYRDNMTVFIDNITAIAPYTDKQRQLVDELRYIRDNVRKQYGICITFICAAHPIKDEPKTKLNEIWKLENICLRGEGTQISLVDKIISIDTTNLGDRYLRVALPKTRTSIVNDEVAVVKIVDATEEVPYVHFEHVCNMKDKDTIKDGAKLPFSVDRDPSDSGSSRKSKRSQWQPTEEDLMRIKQLRDEGVSWEKIGNDLGVDRKTVQKYFSLGINQEPPIIEENLEYKGVA